jgi:thioredoxin-like negative regulator of GroEL
MSAVTAPAPETELQELYARSKGLTLAAAAALVLEADRAGLAEEADRLLADALDARARVARLAPQLSACVDAAQDLLELLDGSSSEADVDRARASHRRLRREVWRVLPCEYVPCCASGHGPER